MLFRSRPARWSKSKTWIRLMAAIAVIGTGSLAFLLFNGEYNTPFGKLRSEAVVPAAFVGSEACASCHHAEADLWNTSQHTHAMQHATATSVLGNFDDTSFDYYGVHSHFFRKMGSLSLKPMAPTATSLPLRSNTRSASIPCSNTSSSSPMVDCRPFQLPGIAAQKTRAASAGFTSIPTRRSSTMISCTGQS